MLLIPLNKFTWKNQDGTDVWDDTKVARIAISCLRGQALKWIERIDHKDADGTNEFFQQPDIPKTPTYYCQK